MSNVIEIPLSKNKLFLVLIGTVIFIVTGLLFVANPETFASSRNLIFIRIIGVVSILFFGLCAVLAVKKLFDKKVGLKIDQSGIFDNSSGVSAGIIEWEDITGVGSAQVASTKFLLIMTDKPEKYLDRATNFISKHGMKANLKMYGTPFSINSTSLKINFKDLEKLITDEFNKRKQKF